MLYDFSNNEKKQINKKGGIILDDIYYGKCILPDSLLNIIKLKEIINISIEELYNKYCINLYNFDGLGYWYKPKQNIYIKSFNIEKKIILKKNIIYIYKQLIDEKIKIIELINGTIIKTTIQHKFCIKRDGKYVWENLLKDNDIILFYNEKLQNKYEFIKISKITLKEYKGYVYDLKIAKCRSYFANGFLCHNTSNNILDINKNKNYLIIVSNYRLNYWKSITNNYNIINNKNDIDKNNINNILISNKNFELFGYNFIKKYNLILDYDNYTINKNFYSLLSIINFNKKWFIINNYKKINSKNNIIKNIINYCFNNKNIIIQNTNILKINKKFKFRYLNFSKDEKNHYDIYINKFKNIYKNNNILFKDDDYLKKYCCFPYKNLCINILNANSLCNIKNDNFINNLGNYKNNFIKNIKNINDIKKNTLCSICLNIMKNDNIGITKCGHIYCYSCIYKCIKINNKCPECRNINIINNLYLYNDQNNENINYNLFDGLGTKFTYLFKMINNLKNVIIFSNYNTNLIFIKNFLKKINIYCDFITNNNINNTNILLINYNNIRNIQNINKKYYIIFLSPYYDNNQNINDEMIKLKYINILNILNKNILDIYFLIMKNSIEEEYIENIENIKL